MELTHAEIFNKDQQEHWNGADGEYWVRQQDRLDRTLAPFLEPLLSSASPVEASTVIDVGCGCGATTIALARQVGPLGRVVALDVSAPMLSLAEKRLSNFPNARCLLGDAASLSLDNVEADLIVSRFGVMFFGDPTAAFANLRLGLKPGGRLCFVCWRPMPENPWLNLPLQAVYQHAPRLPKPLPDEPGPFAFSDPQRVTRILTAAGFSTPTFTPLDVELDISAGGTLEEAVVQASQMGAAKRALANQTDQICAASIESIRQALIPYSSADGVNLPAAVWLVAAERV